MKKNICILLMMRLGSTRIKQKMKQKIGGKYLFEHILNKLDKSKIAQKINIYCAINEKFFFDKLKKYKNISVIKRNFKSVTSDNPKIAYNFLSNIPEKKIMWINACSPFLKIDTIHKAINIFNSNKKIKSMTTVEKKYTWIFNDKSKMINNNIKLSTKALKPIFFATHNFHIFDKKFFIKNINYFANKKNDPYLFEINHIESVDIDYYEELKYARNIYKNKTNFNL